MIRIIVAEKNEMLRLGIKTLFDQHPSKYKVWEVADRTSMINQIREEDCQLVILEPLLCAGGGEALIRQIRRESPTVNVLVYSELDELRYGVRAIRSGARGYLMKNCACSELLAAADRVAVGKLHMSESLAEEVALSAWGGRPSEPHDILSDRERMVFSMLVCGWKVTNIASILNLSAKTVSTHKSRIMTKMRCKGLSQLVEYAITKGIKEECEALCQAW
jgi:two-component system invasion response regulator UvrY